MLSEFNEIFSDVVDTPKLVIEKSEKRKHLKSLINEGKPLSGKTHGRSSV